MSACNTISFFETYRSKAHFHSIDGGQRRTARSESRPAGTCNKAHAGSFPSETLGSPSP